MDYLHEGDTLIVTKLDRLARSVDPYRKSPAAFSVKKSYHKSFPG
ncbi:hypothetical protein [Xenorhabdus koppenhoeferi]